MPLGAPASLRLYYEEEILKVLREMTKDMNDVNNKPEQTRTPSTPSKLIIHSFSNNGIWTLGGLYRNRDVSAAVTPAPACIIYDSGKFLMIYIRKFPCLK
jgi:hypothetical protein